MNRLPTVLAFTWNVDHSRIAVLAKCKRATPQALLSQTSAASWSPLLHLAVPAQMGSQSHQQADNSYQCSGCTVPCISCQRHMRCEMRQWKAQPPSGAAHHRRALVELLVLISPHLLNHRLGLQLQQATIGLLHSHASLLNPPALPQAWPLSHLIQLLGASPAVLQAGSSFLSSRPCGE